MRSLYQNLLTADALYVLSQQVEWAVKYHSLIKIIRRPHARHRGQHQDRIVDN